VSDESEPKSAPGRLDLVRLFLNTWDLEAQTDAWTTPEATSLWLTEQDIVSGAVIPPDDLHRLRAFREALRDFVQHGAELPVESRALMEREMERCFLRMTFCGEHRDDVRITPRRDNVEGAIAWMMILIREAQLEGTWPRLKICREHICRWSFYDSSKNGSSQWCSMQSCGNRAKARRYRARKAAGAPN